MIELSVPLSGLTVGEASLLTVCFTNTGPGLCTQIVFTLSLPPEIVLLDNPKVQLGRLAREERDRLVPGTPAQCGHFSDPEQELLVPGPVWGHAAIR